MSDTILVVEDEKLVRELVSLNLRHAGFEVRLAVNFAEGLAGLTAQPPPSLAIVDVMFPGGDGFLLTRAPPPPPRQGRALSDSHAHRARRHHLEGARPRLRRRRLPHQAVRRARAARA